MKSHLLAALLPLAALTDYWNLTDLTLPTGTPPQGGGVNNPPIDPYGHIHGRSFNADTPGKYRVGFILHDSSGQRTDLRYFFRSA